MSNVSSSNSQKGRIPKLRFPGFEGEWKGKRLDEICDEFIAGGDVDRNKLCENGKYPVFANALTNDGIIGYYENEYKIEAPALTVTGRGDVGHAKARKTNFTPVVRLIAIKGFHNVDFLENAINTLKIAVESTGVPQLTVPQLKKYVVGIPPYLVEEEKIASFLIILDKRIEKQRQLVESLKSYKRGVLLKLFPQNGKTTPQYRFAGFTEPWKQQKIKELFKITRGYVLAASMTNDRQTESTPYPVYSSQTKNDGLMGYYNQYLYENAITWTTDGANAGTVNFRNGKFYCTNVCGVLLADSVVPDQMISEALNSVAKNHVSYVGNPKLMNNVMAEITIALPENEKERQVISSILSYFNKLISFHKEKLDELQSLKAGLLQQLFI